MNNRNTITVSGMAVHGKFENTDDLNFDSLANATEYTKGTQLTNSNMEFKNFGAALGYKHNFAKAGKELTSDLNFNNSNSSSNGLYNIQLFQPDNTPKGGEYLRQTIGNGIINFLPVNWILRTLYRIKLKSKWGQELPSATTKTLVITTFLTPLLPPMFTMNPSAVIINSMTGFLRDM